MQLIVFYGFMDSPWNAAAGVAQRLLQERTAAIYKHAITWQQRFAEASAG